MKLLSQKKLRFVRILHIQTEESIKDSGGETAELMLEETTNTHSRVKDLGPFHWNEKADIVPLDSFRSEDIYVIFLGRSTDTETRFSGV